MFSNLLPHNVGRQAKTYMHIWTGPDTRSMTLRSIIVSIGGRGVRVWADARALLDYDAARPPKGGPAETGGLKASNLSLFDCPTVQQSYADTGCRLEELTNPKTKETDGERERERELKESILSAKC